MKRHTITLGASTTTGGKVIAASSNGMINGVPIALEGDPISCPACKSKGKIVCVGPRIPETWNGKKVALENDVCQCGCAKSPRLLPNQYLSGSSASQTTGILSNAAGAMFDDAYILIDDDTGEPLKNTEYALKRSNGQVEFGTTDEKGRTHLLAASALAESIEIYS